jgi:hypothetical protein
MGAPALPTPPMPAEPPAPGPCVVLVLLSPVVETGPVVELDVSVTLPAAPVTVVSPLPDGVDAKSLMMAMVSVSPLQAVARTNANANRNVEFESMGMTVLHRRIDHQ